MTLNECIKKLLEVAADIKPVSDREYVYVLKEFIRNVKEDDMTTIYNILRIDMEVWKTFKEMISNYVEITYLDKWGVCAQFKIKEGNVA